MIRVWTSDARGATPKEPSVVSVVYSLFSSDLHKYSLALERQDKTKESRTGKLGFPSGFSSVVELPLCVRVVVFRCITIESSEVRRIRFFQYLLDTPVKPLQ
jgi:hypothetical protein